MKKYLWVHNIRSIYNLGSLFRTADALDFTHIYLSGYTPLPIDRFGRERKDLKKVALGAENNLPWTHWENPFKEIKKIKKMGVLCIGIEQDKNAINIFHYQIPKEQKEILIAVGEEVNGMEEKQRNIFDVLLEIPMLGKKESLNVSIAFAIAGYCLLKNH